MQKRCNLLYNNMHFNMEKVKLMCKKGRNIIAVLLCLTLVFAAALPLWARVVVVQRDNVNIRQGAGTTTTVLGKANKGEIFAWQGAVENWTQILTANSRQGYIRNDMLQGYDEVIVTGSSVRIRKAPSLQAEVLGGVAKGDKLAVVGYKDNWYRVVYGQADGWISADYVKLGPPLQNLAADTVLGAAWSADADGENGAGQGYPSIQTPEKAYDFSSVTVSTGMPGGLLSGKTITLDPGHGTITDGKPLDPGAQGIELGIWEKDVNLDITLKLKKILENLGATVWMTHTGETRLDLNGRAAVANRNGSHIFVSIDANSSDNLALNGHSVYFYAPTASERLKPQRGARQSLARAVQESMVRDCGLADLGVKENNFVVLRETNCPSILVETAFLSYAQEELLLAQGAFRQRLADAIALGIMKYFGVA